MNRQTPLSADTGSAAGKPGRFPSQIKYIIGNEAAERFGYYGVVGILELYMAKKMGMSDAQATETLAIFGSAVYFLPLFGGWLADRWLGRYWTILIISLFYCMGNATLAIFEGNKVGLFIGLALIAFGAGGIKPCVSAFVGDQFGPNQQHLLTKIYGWFYWAINLGAAAAFFIVPMLKDHLGYRWAFGVPGIAMGFATLVFWLGTRHYVRRPPLRGKDRMRLFPVIWHALTHSKERKTGEKYLDVALARFSREEVEGARAVLAILVIFATIPFFWALFNQVNSTWVLQGKNMTSMLELRAPGHPPFSEGDINDLPGMVNDLRGQSNQVSSFLWESLPNPDQAALASYQPPLPGTNQPEGIGFFSRLKELFRQPAGPNSNQLQVQGMVVQVLNRAREGPSVYEPARFQGISLRPETTSLLQQSSMGTNEARLNRLLLEDAYAKELSQDPGSYILTAETMQGSESVLVMIWVPILTLWLYPLLERRGLRITALRRMGTGMVLGGLAFVLSGVIQTILDRGTAMSVLWQLAPAIVLEAGEVMLSATALEFAFSQAPPQFKSIIMSFWLMTIAGGHFLIAAFTYLNDHYIKAKGAVWFYMYALVMLAVAGAFIFLATRYRERKWEVA